MVSICMLDPLFYPYYGGAEKHVFEVGKRLAKRHEITVLTSQLPKTKREEVIEGMRVVRTPCLYLEKLPEPFPPPYTVCTNFVWDLLKQKDADVFHIHNQFWYYFDTLAAIKLVMKKKLILTLHNAKPENISFLTDKLGEIYDWAIGSKIMAVSDRIIAVSNYTKQVTVPDKYKRKADVIWNGVDTGKFTPRNSRERIRRKFGVGDEPLVLSNFRLVKQKGGAYLVDAFSKVKKELKDARLIVIGKGPLRESLEKECARHGVSNSVSFVTGIPENELPFYYSAADVFVLPSLWEPCAVVLLEAMASGKPMVATAVGGTPELVSKDCGVLVKPKDGNALAEGILHVLGDEKVKRRMGAASRKRAVENFGWDVVAKKVEAVYKKVVSAPERRAFGEFGLKAVVKKVKRSLQKRGFIGM